MKKKAKEAEIKIKVHKRKKHIPQKFSIAIKYDNRTKLAKMGVKPDIPTDMVQNVLRSILAILDKEYPPEEPKTPSYIQ